MFCRASLQMGSTRYSGRNTGSGDGLEVARWKLGFAPTSRVPQVAKVFNFEQTRVAFDRDNSADSRFFTKRKPLELVSEMGRKLFRRAPIGSSAWRKMGIWFYVG